MLLNVKNKIKKNLEWKLVKTIELSNTDNIDLPSGWNEIHIMVRRSSAVCYTTSILKGEVTSTTRTFYTGHGTTSYNNYATLEITSSNVKVTNFIVNGNDRKIEGSYMQIYYR